MAMIINTAMIINMDVIINMAMINGCRLAVKRRPLTTTVQPIRVRGWARRCSERSAGGPNTRS
jgi:hypothetical protein